MQEEKNKSQQPQSQPQLQSQSQQQQQQQLLPNMSTTSSSRHYVDKARLIKLVHENPILWDCRLPNYKRADKSKTDQWNSLGAIFNVSGERVQRTFTSLREIFRRELNNEKLLGRRFKSKWEFYKSMSFLRDVIRERKPRERHAAKLNRRNQLSPSVNNAPSNSNGIDEYQYFAPNDPNNPSLQQQQQQQSQQQQQQQHLHRQQSQAQQQPPPQMQPAPQSNNDKSASTALQSDLTQLTLGNNSQLSVLSLLTQLSNGAQQQQEPQLQQHQQQHQQVQHQQQSNHQTKNNNTNNNNNNKKNSNDDDYNDVNIVQPSPPSSTTPSMYIKDEIEIPDEDDDDDEEEEDTTSITFNGEILYTNSNKVNIINSNMLNDINESAAGRGKRRTKSNRNSRKNWKRINNNKKNVKNDCEILEDGDGDGGGDGVGDGDADGDDDDDDVDIDVDEDELSSVESVPNTKNQKKIVIGNGLGNNLSDETKGNHDLVHEQLSSVSCIGAGIGNVIGGGGGGGGVGGVQPIGCNQIVNINSGEAEVKYRRHLVYTKFADFIVAKMDAMCERDADDLMDRMMLVIAQKH